MYLSIPIPIFLSSLSKSWGQGWYDFALEHELELDDILVFKVIDDSSMKVEIYESNSSTQRVNFCADHP
jgi:hypothetical protein